jgi:tRNA U34 5-carboxymethylaminomethyl modifying GTPase MnmE/TrmE
VDILSEKYEEQVRQFAETLRARIQYLDEQKKKAEKEKLEKLMKKVSEYLENLNRKDVEVDDKPKLWRKGRIKK